MATFAISLSVDIDAKDYAEAFEIRESLFEFIEGHEAVTGGPYEIDVEQQDGFLDEDEE